MARKTYKVDILSPSSIKTLKNDLTAYRNSLKEKCKRLVTELAEEGITVARNETTNGFGRYVSFSIKLEPQTDGCKALILATNTGTITSQWKTKDGMKSADVSPLFMLEFGSGNYAENPKNIPNAGQGTFPGQIHAFDKEGWYWVDENDQLHHSYGIRPQMPMYKASLRIFEIVSKKAKEVFSNG